MRVSGAPVWLVRLLMHSGLSRDAAARLRPEERLSVDFANHLRAQTLDGNLRAVWFHPANELIGRTSSGARAAVARSMGLMPGAADFIFLGDQRCLALEAKVGRNDLSPAQQDFRYWCESTQVPYRTFRSVDEGLAHLRSAGLLL